MRVNSATSAVPTSADPRFSRLSAANVDVALWRTLKPWIVGVALLFTACSEDASKTSLLVGGTGGPGQLEEYFGDGTGTDAIIGKDSGQPGEDLGESFEDNIDPELDSGGTGDGIGDPDVVAADVGGDATVDPPETVDDALDTHEDEEITEGDGGITDGTSFEDATVDVMPDAAADAIADTGPDTVVDTWEPDIQVTPDCPDPTCLLCRPCLTDEDCNPVGGGNNQCLPFGPEGSFCGLACDDNTLCPDGYTCFEGDGDAQCVPDTGQGCPCSEEFVDAVTACFVETDAGVCEALRTCAEPCPAQTPTAEKCNGNDDNCNGLTDEDLGTVLCGTGACEHSIFVCIDGKPETCDALLGASPEVCNGLDDDCNGKIDENLGTISCGLGPCAKTLAACVDGKPLECDPLTGTAPEICNGIDDDCDGKVDEDLPELPCGLGECTHWVSGCVDGKPGVCDPLKGAAPELCNGLDDDCNGDTDEDLGQTTCGIGPCAHDVPLCDLGQPGVCNPLLGAKTETCNGIDDNCNGETDEELGQITCGKGPCLQTIAACSGGTAGVCDPLSGSKPETCNGIDDDCDGATDEDLGQITCGKGPCLQSITACSDGKPTLCDPLAGAKPETCNGFDDDCDGDIDEGLGQITCGKGPCLQTIAACSVGVPSVCDPLFGAKPEVCNGIDDDCDGETDEGQGQITCGKGPCLQTITACKDGKPTICDPLAGAKPETCNGADDDCDGATDEDLGVLECGQGKCFNQIAACINGQPQKCEPKASSAEVCNTIDDDCDGQVNEGNACPCASKVFEGHVYMFCNTKVTWNTAKVLCGNSGFQLVTLTSAAENAFVTAAAAGYSTNPWWIGYTDSAKEGVWVWDNKEPVSWGPNWAVGEPNNSGNEDCGIIAVSANSGKWVDAGCYESFAYICEK